MSNPSLPDWHTPQECLDILSALPENRRNRALYLLPDLYAGEDFQTAHAAVLRLLLRSPQLRGLENVKCWLYEVLSGGADWTAWQTEILAASDGLHPETCRTFGDWVGMHDDTAVEETKALVHALFALPPSPQAVEILFGCLYWHETLCRRHPEWDEWLRNQIRPQPAKEGKP